MLDTATSSIKEQLLSRVRLGSPHQDYFQRTIGLIFAIGDTFETERSRVQKDGRFTEQGKREAIAALVIDRFAAELAAVGRVSRRATARNESQRAAIGRPAFDNSDLAAGLERREVRDYVRSSPQGQRLQVAFELVKDRKLGEAILSGPSSILTGLNGDEFAKLHRVYLQTHYAEELAEVEAIAEDIAAVTAALQIVEKKLSDGAALPAITFEKLMKPLKEKADAA